METKLCKNLQDERFDLFCNYNQNNEDMEQFKKDFSLDVDITGLIGEIGEGEIVELWATTDNRPWDLSATYEKVI